MATQLNDIAIWVNDVQIAYTGDSLSWQDGFGEYSMRNAVVGGGVTEQVFSQDLSTKTGMIKFTMPSTPENEENKRTWKLLKNQNTVRLVGPVGSNFTKNFSNACILNDPETSAATEGNIEIEFKSNPAT